ALEMARQSRGGRRLVGLVAHSDAGSQSTSVRFTERLDEIGARPSIGTVADSFDNALAETTNGLYKAECVYGPDAAGWDDADEVELATLSWVRWFNEHRSTATATTCRQRSSKGRSTLPHRPTPKGLEPNSPSLHQTQGGSVRFRALVLVAAYGGCVGRSWPAYVRPG
ncbi:MAG: integrase core domain-containing protein, partial [Actinobacteria bacterium]|nr:integrase core domain-containing protein [Actinomycetota bacterium]